ncbi:hypothetical protein C1H46_032226 [Malus baccata]|uniref:Uncharacterized protein n=1 Tax=Malus baccata TaxID=106549 RepID=A0A540L6U9_MALBA|nr:hypothetical protein C1H46_032226 [Malus baccata]
MRSFFFNLAFDILFDSSLLFFFISTTIFGELVFDLGRTTRIGVGYLNQRRTVVVEGSS